MNKRLILGIAALVIGVMLIGLSIFMGMYIEKQLEDGIESSLVLDVENMQDPAGDFYIRQDDTKHYYFYNITDETAVLDGTGGYDLVGPIQLSKTNHRLVLSNDEEKNTVTYVEFPTEITYYSESDDALSQQEVTMFNLNWYAFHALQGEISILGNVIAEIVAATSDSALAWNAVSGMNVNQAQYTLMTSGNYSIYDPTTIGMILAHPTYSDVLSGEWMGVNTTEMTTLAYFMGAQYSTVVPQVIQGDGMAQIATHTIDEWLFGWDSMIFGGMADGLIYGETYTDSEVQAMTLQEMVYAPNVDVYTISTGEDDVSNAYTVVADKGTTGLLWSPLVEDMSGYEWTYFTPEDEAKIDVVWGPGVSKDDSLTLWDSTIGLGSITYEKETSIKGIETYRFRADESNRDLTPALNAQLGAQGTIYNPFEYYASGYVWVDVEPTLGVGLRADKYFEFSIQDGTADGVAYKHFVARELGEVDDSEATDFKDTVYAAQDLSNNVSLYGTLSSVLVALIGVAVILVSLKK